MGSPQAVPLFASKADDAWLAYAFFIILVLVIFFASGGGQWIARFVRSRSTAFKVAGALAFLTSLVLVADFEIHGDDKIKVVSRSEYSQIAFATEYTGWRYYGGATFEKLHNEMPYAVLFGLGSLIALVLLPLYFVSVLVLGVLYRLFVAPIVEFFGFLGSLFGAARTRPLPGPSPAELQRERDAAAERAGQDRTARRRREDARARCELFFTLHAPEVGPRFSKAMFDDYLRRYMGDDREPEDVEQRGDALLSVIQQHLDKVQPEQKFRSLEDIARWFEDQKRQIDALPDERLRQTLLATLKARYAELTTQFLEEMRA